MKRLLTIALLACGLAAAHAGERRLDAAPVLDRVVLDDTAAGRIAELSGLDWDGARGLLLAVSDRGTLHERQLDLEGGRIAAVVSRGRTLVRPGSPPNAESVVRVAALGRAAETWVVDEADHGVLAVAADGRVSHAVPLPAALRDAARLRKGNDGIEGVAWHARHGLIAATQRPLRGSDRGTHRLHAADGSEFAFVAADAERSSVKALHLVDDRRLLVLEKVSAVAGAPRTLLRELLLDECAAARPCDPKAVELAGGTFDAAANYEGLACLDAALCLIASDGTARRPALLLLVALVRR